MRSATLQVYYYSRIFCHIKLRWITGAPVDVGFWTCLPGYFGHGVTFGRWDTSWLTNTLALQDAEGEEVAYCRDVGVSLIGFPLSDLEGDKGDFRLMPAGRGGVLSDQNLWWRLLDIG